MKFPLQLSCFCLMTLFGGMLGQGPVVVKEGNDAILNCSPSTKEDLRSKLFDWKKDGQKEVFLYDRGNTYNNGRSGQDQQFKGRVSHFKDKLEHGNASIKIINTTVYDSGVYSCIFPRLQPSQTFYIQLVVATGKPSVTALETKNWAVLQCVVRGAFPKPKVEWRDSAGNIVHAEEPQVKERGGSYDIILKTTVTKANNYRCVVTQEEINHQTEAEIYVHTDPPKSESHTGLITGVILAFVFLIIALVAVVIYFKRQFRRGLVHMSQLSGSVQTLIQQLKELKQGTEQALEQELGEIKKIIQKNDLALDQELRDIEKMIQKNDLALKQELGEIKKMIQKKDPEYANAYPEYANADLFS